MDSFDSEEAASPARNAETATAYAKSNIVKGMKGVEVNVYCILYIVVKGMSILWKE